MNKYPVPAFVLAAVADAVAEAETHASLDSLFMYAEAPGDPASSAAMIRDNTDELKRVVDAMYINGYLMSLQEHGLVSLHVLEQLRVERDRAFAVTEEARD